LNPRASSALITARTRPTGVVNPVTLVITFKPTRRLAPGASGFPNRFSKSAINPFTAAW